jgi:transaldolase
MRFYADSARLERVVPLLEAGLVAGVTSNPTILLRDGHHTSGRRDLYRTFAAAGAGDILMQAVGATAIEMMADAETLSSYGDHMIVKVPATETGFRTVAQLSDRSAPVPVLVTAVFSVAQAAFAASLGARYVAPYFGRMTDRSVDALETLARMDRAIAGSGTQLLVASVRSADQVEQLVDIGVKNITADVHVLLEVMLHSDSELSAADFERDAMSAGG